MSKIFISYRRDDSAPIAGRIYDRLIAHFGKDAVFKDVDSIPYGENFPRYIRSIIGQCSVMLAIIGPAWSGAETADGNRRLDDPQDWVRVEVETALSLGVIVIPLLVMGARMPKVPTLPESLASLSEINSLAVRNDPDFNGDMYRLQTTLERWVPAVAIATQQTGASQHTSRQPIDVRAKPQGSATPERALPVMPAAPPAQPRLLGAPFALIVGACVGAVPAVFATLAVQESLGSWSFLWLGWLIAGALAPGAGGFLASRRTQLLQSALLSGFTTGIVAWLPTLFFQGLNPFHSHTVGLADVVACVVVLVVTLPLSAFGGAIGRAVARGEKVPAPAAAGR